MTALPLLFGCSSVAQLGQGGRARPSGVSDKYIMAGWFVLTNFQINVLKLSLKLLISDVQQIFLAGPKYSGVAVIRVPTKRVLV